MESIKVVLHDFSLDEFRCKCCGATDMDTKLLICVQALRYAIGVPIKINSGYRCTKHNEDVKGVEKSQHTLGKAADLSFPTATTQKELTDIFEKAKASGLFSTVLLYRKSRFIHVDVRHRDTPVYSEFLTK